MTEKLSEIPRISDFVSSEHVSASISRDTLKKYSKKVEDFLQEEEERFQKKHSKLEVKTKKLSPEDQYLYEEFYNEQLYQYSVEFPRILRNSFLLIIISLLESELATLCKELKEKHRIPIGWKDLKGSTIDQVKKYCEIAGLDYTKNNENWQEMKNFYLVRNCIIHNDGILKDTRDEKILRAYARKKGILSEDILDLTPEFYNNVINVTEDFTDKVWDMVFRLRPKIRTGVQEGRRTQNPP
ncbi:hypothetical protein ACFLWG_00860 [Chloroflexota bacterium]